MSENPREIHFPVGTVEEVQALGLDPKEVRTCSASLDNRNKGCRFYGHSGGCRFREVWNAKGGPQGPENRGVYKIIEDTGATQGFILPCYAIMETMSERMDQAKKIGEIYSGFRKPGEKIKRTYSEKLHKTKDANCTACQKNDCNKMHMVTVEIEIPEHIRPAERFGNTAFQNEIMDEMTENIDFDARMSGADRIAIKREQLDKNVARDASANAKPSGLEGLRKNG
jgi:hypothetical protein